MNEKTMQTADTGTVDIIAREKQAVEDLIAMRAITAENAVFSRTVGGFVSLEYNGKTYPRVAIHRCFPHSDPTHYISVRLPDNDGKEIGLIEDITTLSQDTQTMLQEQMELRYFSPKILKIYDIKAEYGYSYWDVLTDRGRCRFTARMGGNSVYSIGPDRYLVNDLDGNRFEIVNISALSAKEIKKLDIFI
ncbi:MAG: DUF1854 domain-containing protein [Ruminococcaceae bacterium]|nr:DUF1854 domain-containing protein [Oscillospiraceae bacterium]